MLGFVLLAVALRSRNVPVPPTIGGVYALGSRARMPVDVRTAPAATVALRVPPGRELMPLVSRRLATWSSPAATVMVPVVSDPYCVGSLADPKARLLVNVNLPAPALVNGVAFVPVIAPPRVRAAPAPGTSIVPPPVPRVKFRSDVPEVPGSV